MGYKDRGSAGRHATALVKMLPKGSMIFKKTVALYRRAN